MPKANHSGTALPTLKSCKSSLRPTSRSSLTLGTWKQMYGFVNVCINVSRLRARNPVSWVVWLPSLRVHFGYVIVFLLFQAYLTDWFVLNSMGFPADIISLSLWEGSSLPLPGLQDLIFDHCSSHQHPTHPHLHLSLKGFTTSLASYSQSSSLTMPHPPSSCSLHATPCWLGVGWDGMGISLWWVVWCSFLEVEPSFSWTYKRRRGFYLLVLKLLWCLRRMGFLRPFRRRRLPFHLRLIVWFLHFHEIQKSRKFTIFMLPRLLPRLSWEKYQVLAIWWMTVETIYIVTTTIHS